MKSESQSFRFNSREIQVGDQSLGGSSRIAIQSMTTTDTMDIAGTLQQTKDLVEAGCDIIRITAPTMNDAEALKEISKQLRDAGINNPLVADIHFLPKAAMAAAKYVEKVRINPGNFADRKMFKTKEYSDEEYSKEILRIEEKFKPLVLELKARGRALRIGTNHGSLSDRIMNRFGDTPEGMIESAFEYAEICRKYDFHNFCFSMKASNVRVMIEAYRLLAKKQRERSWNYPIHLGVTEAGDGEDARIKSSIGIGTLLSEGIGDTIRVSLTEASVHEIPVARAIADRFPREFEAQSSNYQLSPNADLSSKNQPLVFLKYEKGLPKKLSGQELRPDVLFVDNADLMEMSLAAFKEMMARQLGVPTLKIAVTSAFSAIDRESADYVFDENLKLVTGIESLKAFEELQPAETVIHWKLDQSMNELQRIIETSYQCGSSFIDLPLFGIFIEAEDLVESLRLSFGILQASRRRMSKTEYIACPSCGRTLFDLEETTARIRKVTSHLKGVKIAVMGCIVNGPGEMADADFGYVGGAPGRVNLYVEKDCVERNIPSAEAPERLVELIKKNGKWFEPEKQKASA